MGISPICYLDRHCNDTVLPLLSPSTIRQATQACFRKGSPEALGLDWHVAVRWERSLVSSRLDVGIRSLSYVPFPKSRFL